MALTEPARGRLGEVWFRTGPVLVVLAVVLVLWYALAIALNAAQVIERTLSSQPGWTMLDLARLTLSMDRPVCRSISILSGPSIGSRDPSAAT